MLTTLKTHLAQHFDTELLNLTRDRDYVAGVLSGTNLVRTIVDMWRVLRTAKDFDVVYLHSSFVPAVTVVRAGLLMAAARLRRSQVVLHVHGGPLPEWASSSARRRLVRAGLSPASAVIAVSDGIRSALPSDRAHTVLNGVDLEQFHPSYSHVDGPPTVLYVGLLTRRKGVVDLIEASKLVAARGIDHRLRLIGGRPDEGGEEEEAVRSAAVGSEDFIGSVRHEEMPGFLQSADVFCLPSWYEAMPLSVLEAMASGLPVVATRVGQIPDVVSSEVGRLVAPSDPDGLADALAELLCSRELRERLGANARRTATAEYSLDENLGEIRRIIETVVDQGRRA